jgi:hypothetical protein
MKINRFILAALAILLVMGPILISCQIAAGDDGSGPFTGYVSAEDNAVAPELPRHQLPTGPVNPPGLEIEVINQADGSTLFEASGDVGTDFVNDTVARDFTGQTAGSPGSYTMFNYRGRSTKISTMVITGIVDPAKPGIIRQYNEALNLYAAPDPATFVGWLTPNVYKEKYYPVGANSYYADALGGFDVLLWEGATNKVIKLIVTQDGVTKTYIIDYSDTVFQ